MKEFIPVMAASCVGIVIGFLICYAMGIVEICYL